MLSNDLGCCRLLIADWRFMPLIALRKQHRKPLSLQGMPQNHMLSSRWAKY